MDAVMAFLARDFYLVVLVLAAAALVFLYRARPAAGAVAALGIGGLAFLLAQVGARLIASPRPFQVSGVPPLIPSAADNGFPSDHTLLLAWAAALVTLANRPLGALFWLLALLVGLARVYAGVHHVVDVAGSLVIVALATLGYLLARRRLPF